MNPIQKINQIGVPVKDMKRAIAFYQSLHLPLLFSTDTMAFFDCNGTRLLLSLPENEAFTFPSSVVYFQVENIRKTYDDYQKVGISFIDEPHLVAKMGATETWMTFFNDTEGNTHAFMSEVESE
ncbi:putative enzyme related to lactoylglutathione lyase [Alkalihalobacillus xiaoxiensis]|uniref:Enzyme related to lactoylglutathione lyase n=2 Tax=Shouchella xiaoxiensis TaxID=766895 RepID=A0ABS2SNW8_9BACI|nr:VOC family protein [Shouchella xiaoxiensis]MBM7836930.1 putative enzyme related to lactoylglutathione lyase [Shouchella xiaoxiensis]